MKKIIYAILACIIIIGTIIILTIGLKADIIYSKNVEIDMYIGKTVELDDIKTIAREVFPNEKIIVQKIELFDDMVSITLQEKSDEELKETINQLNAKINEKYGTENKVETHYQVIHNPKIKLSSILRPYIMPIIISTIIILIYVGIRYKKLGILKTFVSYIAHVVISEAVFISALAITRFPINRLIIPIGLVIYITTITVLSIRNEKRLQEKVSLENSKK